MDDPVPSTKKPGSLKGGQCGRSKNRHLLAKECKGMECNQEQAEVVAEPNDIYDELSSSGLAAAEVETPSIVED
jgi:hypothetical protein